MAVACLPGWVEGETCCDMRTLNACMYAQLLLSQSCCTRPLVWWPLATRPWICEVLFRRGQDCDSAMRCLGASLLSFHHYMQLRCVVLDTCLCRLDTHCFDCARAMRVQVVADSRVEAMVDIIAVRAPFMKDLIFAGMYSDISPNWHRFVGPKMLLTLVIQCIVIVAKTGYTFAMLRWSRRRAKHAPTQPDMNLCASHAACSACPRVLQALPSHQPTAMTRSHGRNTWMDAATIVRVVPCMTRLAAVARGTQFRDPVMWSLHGKLCGYLLP